LRIDVPPASSSTEPSLFPLIVSPYARRHQPLSGDWRVIVDPLSSGDSSPVAIGVEGAGFYQDRVPADGLELIEYAFVESESLHVPGDWNSQRDQLFFYEGVVWYRRTFYRPPPGRRAFLYIGAANYRCDVYLNGRLCGRHEGGFTPFNIEVTDLLREGENLLVMKVDNRMSADTVPTDKTDWFNRGGITRDVLLIDTAPTFIRSFHLRLTDLERREVEVTATLDGSNSADGIAIEIPELDLRIPLQPDGSGSFQARFHAPVELWSPENPRLYDVIFHCGDEPLLERVGFRTVAVNGGEILLNGAPIFLKGIATHEESPLHLGRAQGREDALAILELAQQLGVNFVRLAHYPHDEAIVRAADELGILLWSEIPVYWSVNWNSPAALATARSQLGAMIARDNNRASVIIWSVSNETPIGEDRLAYLSTLISDAREADPDRLVSSALFGNPRAFLKSYAPRLMAQIALSPG
jgi:beta-glucuronidase